MLTLLTFLLVITAVVLPHELGHFFFALRAGIRPLELGIGLGPKLFSFKAGRTRYSINLLPLGGFIRIAGLNPEEEKEDEPYLPQESYISKRPLDKALMILGGPAMNFVFAFLILSVVFATFGSPVGISNEIGSVFPGSEGERIGLKPGDRILSIDGFPIEKMEGAIEKIHKSAGKKLLLRIDRHGQRFEVEATPQYNPKLKIGLIGFSPKPIYRRQGPLLALWLGAKETIGMVLLIFYFLGLLATGRVSITDLAGPVGIAQFTGQAAHGGFVALLGFTAFLSVNLGVVNLLPIPALDGGRLFFVFIEALRRKPLPQKIENKIHYAGIIVLLGLIFVLTINDIIRWVSMR